MHLITSKNKLNNSKTKQIPCLSAHCLEVSAHSDWTRWRRWKSLEVKLFSARASIHPIMQRWAAFYSLGSKMHGQAALRYLAVDIYTLFTVKITVIFWLFKIKGQLQTFLFKKLAMEPPQTHQPPIKRHWKLLSNFCHFTKLLGMMILSISLMAAFCFP